MTGTQLYERSARFYDLVTAAPEKRLLEKALGLFSARTGESVLEIGFGTGNALVTLAQAVGSQGRVFGVEASPAMKRVAEKKLGSGTSVELQTAHVPPLPYEDESLDGVFMSFVLETLPLADRAVLLKEILRVLKPGGRLCILAMDDREDRKRTLMEKLYLMGHSFFPSIIDCDLIGVRDEMGAAGFTMLKVEEVSLFQLPAVIALAVKSALANDYFGG